VTIELEIRRGRSGDLATAQTWLAEAGLPIEDLTATEMGAFLIALTESKPVGMIGLESYSHIGLLRSLIVDEQYRGNGLGAYLVAALEAKATADGVSELWLLTIDADQFFAGHGYETTQRVDVPITIQYSAEYSLLCPDDAVLMKKNL
jgi:amino-acid N-acetyltransferase